MNMIKQLEGLWILINLSTPSMAVHMGGTEDVKFVKWKANGMQGGVVMVFFEGLESGR